MLNGWVTDESWPRARESGVKGVRYIGIFNGIGQCWSFFDESSNDVMLVNSTDTGQNWYPAWQVMVCKRFQWMLVLWPYWTKCHFPQHNISSMYDFFKNIYFSKRLIFFKTVWNKISNFSLRLSNLLVTSCGLILRSLMSSLLILSFL